MKLDFPQGSLDKSMSDEMQDLFFEKLKPAVWFVYTEINDKRITGTGFCVDSEQMLLLTTAHTFDESWNGQEHVPMEYIKVGARRDLDPDDAMVTCKVVCLWKTLDLAILQIQDKNKKKLNFKDLDYVSFDNNFIRSRQLSVGMELFSIGLPGSQGFQIIRGMLTYEFSNDLIDYSDIANDEDFLTKYEYKPNSDVIESMRGNRRVPRNSETTTNFYKDNLHGVVIEDSFDNNGEMHPKVKLLQMDFGSIQQIAGMSGSPIFNSKGNIVGMMLASRYGSIYGLPSTALDAMLTSYKAKISGEEEL